MERGLAVTRIAIIKSWLKGQNSGEKRKKRIAKRETGFEVKLTMRDSIRVGDRMNASAIKVYTTSDI